MTKVGFKKLLTIILCTLTWLLLWEILARIVNNRAFFSGAIDTLAALARLIFTKAFWRAILFSIFRIILGYILGTVFGALIAFLCIKSKICNAFFSLGMTVVKSTPVASIIMICWVIIRKEAFLPSLIGLLMVAPIIWQNLMDGHRAINSQLDEVTKVFAFSKAKRFKLLVFPTLLQYFVPAALSCVGLAWKSGIATEIISVARDSIGYYIKMNKETFDSEIMLAWTLAVIIISLIAEHTVKYFLRRVSARESYPKKH